MKDLFFFDATVSKIVQETPTVKTFRLDLAPSAGLGFRAGQFFQIAFPDHPADKRTFSIASSPLDTSFLETTVEVSGGDFSGRLFSLEGGERLLVTRPTGKWAFRDEDRRAVLIASDSAIVPYRSMIKYVLDKGLPNKLHLFYAAATPGTIIYRRELEEFAGKGVFVRTTVREVPENEDEGLWEGPIGPLRWSDIRVLVEDHGAAVYYLCGGGKFIDAIRPKMEKDGVPPENILVSKWGDY